MLNLNQPSLFIKVSMALGISSKRVGGWFVYMSMILSLFIPLLLFLLLPLALAT